MKKYEEAAEHFAAAAELDPGYVLARCNLATAMLHLKRYDAAEKAARKALTLARPLPEMSFILGLSLGAQRRNQMKRSRISIERRRRIRPLALPLYIFSLKLAGAVMQ
jgi:tetratricopeptide (TPR) repeat protein